MHQTKDGVDVFSVRTRNEILQLPLSYTFPNLYKFFRSSSHFKLDLEKGEKVDIVVYTRCCSGALFQVIDDKKTVVVDEVDVAHKGGSDVDKDKPTKTSIVVGLAGPGKYKIKAVLKSSHFSSVHFFVVCNIFN